MHLDGCFWGQLYFGKYSWMAASRRQLQRYICFRNYRLRIFDISYCDYYDVMLKKNEFLRIFSSKSFGEKCKHTKLPVYFIQKQYFS